MYVLSTLLVMAMTQEDKFFEVLSPLGVSREVMMDLRAKNPRLDRHELACLVLDERARDEREKELSAREQNGTVLETGNAPGVVVPQANPSGAAVPEGMFAQGAVPRALPAPDTSACALERLQGYNLTPAGWQVIELGIADPETVCALIRQYPEMAHNADLLVTCLLEGAPPPRHRLPYNDPDSLPYDAPERIQEQEMLLAHFAATHLKEETAPAIPYEEAVTSLQAELAKFAETEEGDSMRLFDPKRPFDPLQPFSQNEYSIASMACANLSGSAEEKWEKTKELFITVFGEERGAAVYKVLSLGVEDL